jgi:hypothetical protein
LVDAELKKIEYEIIKKEKIHSFYAVIFNAKNHLALQKYINLLVGGKSRNAEIYVHGNLWLEYNLVVNIVKMKIKRLIRKKYHSKKN